jgi:hypothetical protein
VSLAGLALAILLLSTMTVAGIAFPALESSVHADQPSNLQTPPVTEFGVTGAHTHHVNTPAGCVDIDAVYFLPADNGLHRGSNASTIDHGPFHGACP